MNKNMLRKLLAALMACAMLLCSVAAFADEETESGFAGIFVMPVPEEENETSAEPEVPEEGETVETEESAETPAEDESEEAAAEDEEIAEEEEPEELPEETEESDDEYQIAPLYLKENVHVHKYEPDPDYDEEGNEIPNNPYFTEYFKIDENEHKVIVSFSQLYYCKGCNDRKYVGFTTTYTEPHSADCELCNTGSQGTPMECNHIDEEGNSLVDITKTTDSYLWMKDYANVGHRKLYEIRGEGTCTKCGKYVTDIHTYEILMENHTFVNGKCACGYTNTTAAKDEPVRSATGMVNEIKALVADGAVITITDEAVAYTADELFSLSAITDPIERVLVLMTALDMGDEVDHTVAWLGLTLSDETKALIETVKARVAAEGVIGEAQLAFPVVSETINGKVYDAIHITIVATKADGSAVTETFCFYKDGSKWYFNTVEKA